MHANTSDFILQVSLDFIFLVFDLILSFHLYLQIIHRRELRAMAVPTLCVLCSDPLQTDGRLMTCTDCMHAYHPEKNALESRKANLNE